MRIMQCRDHLTCSFCEAWRFEGASIACMTCGNFEAWALTVCFGQEVPEKVQDLGSGLMQCWLWSSTQRSCRSCAQDSSRIALNPWASRVCRNSEHQITLCKVGTNALSRTSRKHETSDIQEYHMPCSI